MEIQIGTYDKYKKSYPNLTDAEIIDRLGKELANKVETIYQLLDELENLRGINPNHVNKDGVIWHDANKVFPEFDKKVIGYYTIESRGVLHEIYDVCRLLSINENSSGKSPYYQDDNHNGINPLYWTELPLFNEIKK